MQRPVHELSLARGKALKGLSEISVRRFPSRERLGYDRDRVELGARDLREERVAGLRLLARGLARDVFACVLRARALRAPCKLVGNGKP